MAISNTKERDIVLFLGAGFSQDAGLPVMSEFGQKSRTDNRGLWEHASAQYATNHFRYAAPMLVDAAEVFKRFQQFCRASPTLRDNDVDNMETVFCIAEAMFEANLKSIEFGDEEWAIEELIRQIQLWLWKAFQVCPPLDQKRRDEIHTESYVRFFKSLSQLELSSRLAVITTNYDLIFEYLSWKNEMPSYYPLEEFESISISIGGDAEPFAYLNSQDDKNTKGPLLCKLHGSINYFQGNSNDNRLYVANLLGGGKRIGNSGDIYWKDKPAIFAVDSIWCIRNKYGSGLTPAIIPPTYAKLTQQHWLRNIWNTALNVLSNAKKIIFIGYSMPDSDGFMRALMHSALAIRASNKNSMPPQVFVIDSSEETHRRHQKLFHEIYKPLQPLPFSEATKSVIPEILSKTNC